MSVVYLQNLVVLIGFVGTDDDPFAGFQTFSHLVVLGILPPYAYLAAVGAVAVFVENENPVAPGHAVERSLRYEDGRLRLAQLQVDVVGLARADVGRTAALKGKIDLETSVAHLGIDLAHT